MSLGRSIGLLPAQRKLVSQGAYRYMRHPIYTGVFFAYLAMTLARYSLFNATLFATGAGLFVLKSFVEEEFLRKDPGYAAYMKAVPWRWFPFIA
jgi:protein-S-isoprenylcysteine O-methyltransferase Ste14